MLKNYIKIAWKVLMRRKLFTFISLFGISFTLTILITGAAFYDYLLNSQYPELKQDRILYVDYINVWGETQGTNHYHGSPGYHYVDKYVKSMETPAVISGFTNIFQETKTYRNNKKTTLHLKYTDNEFWQVFDFNFLKGRPYNELELANETPVAVISESLAKDYFGSVNEALGKTMLLNQNNYRVSGIVKDVPIVRIHSYGNIWMPVTTSPNKMNNQEITGGYAAALLAEKRGNFSEIKNEYNNMVEKIDIAAYPPYENIRAFAEPTIDGIARDVFDSDKENSGKNILLAIMLFLIFLFMLLPAINLVNINVNRIYERMSEIGIRKSFGAAKNTLLVQFIVENIMITFIGSAIAISFSAILLQLIENSGIIPYANLGINVMVVFYGIILSLLFGLLSGVLPAFRMAKLQIIEAFKGGAS